MGFMDELDSAIEEGKENKTKRENAPKPNLVAKIKGMRGAYKRVKEKGGLSKSWASEEEIIERRVCCTLCTDGNDCPYCGCKIKKPWFLPLGVGKSDLITEGCPNPNTYPHLKKFPPKNYWQVTQELTSVILAARNEEHLTKTVDNLIKNATGKIEILVGLDGGDEWGYDSEKVKIIREEKPIGRRKISNKLAKMATGKYLFEVDAHCILDLGWDTMLKVLCDENTIVSCVFDEINEKKWESKGHEFLGCYMDKDLNWKWCINILERKKWGKVKQMVSFFSGAWMIQKDTFWKYRGHKEYLGEHINEDIEWTCNVLGSGGKILVRTDIKCAHLFRKEFPYPNNDNYLVSKSVLHKLIKEEDKKRIEASIKDFRQKYNNIQ